MQMAKLPAITFPHIKNEEVPVLYKGATPIIIRPAHHVALKRKRLPPQKNIHPIEHK